MNTVRVTRPPSRPLGQVSRALASRHVWHPRAVDARGAPELERTRALSLVAGRERKTSRIEGIGDQLSLDLVRVGGMRDTGGAAVNSPEAAVC